MKELNDDEMIRMADEYLEEPNSNDPQWEQFIIQVRRMLLRKKDGDT